MMWLWLQRGFEGSYKPFFPIQNEDFLPVKYHFSSILLNPYAAGSENLKNDLNPGKWILI